MSIAHGHQYNRRERRPGSGAPSRRLLLGLAGAGAVELGAASTASASEAAAPASAAGGSRTRVETPPQTLVTESASGAELAAVDFPVGYVSVRWTGPRRGAVVRFRSASGAFGPWRDVSAACPGARDDLGGAGRGHWALVAADSAAGAGALGYELRLPAGAADVRSAAINTGSGPAAAFAPPPSTRALGLTYRSRASWGADEALRHDRAGAELWPPVYSPAQAVTVHHTVTANDDPDPAATIRALYHHHAVGLRWGDIGYHFLVDQAGRLYEGRWSGADGIPGHRADGQVATAGHVLNHNSGNIGVALLGDFTRGAPTGAAKRTLTRTLAALARFHGLDPLRTVHYVNPANHAAKDVAAVSGHRDWLATACPGGALYRELSSVRADVARLLA
jgi:hypothetical protein